MKTYPTDSQEAVCRLLALSMIVDGHLAPAEVKAMEHAAILERVGADADGFDAVVHALCEDLLATARCRAGCEVELDKRLIDSLLDEVADPLLRMCTLKAMLDIVHADRLIDGREHLLLQRALKKWSTPAHERLPVPEG
ncbi:TerB family tellurite resistance protein [Massilia niabensis]|uniref:TerB family tellurite resistance protein n=1 Tax=Massilia niabensis TaxID=544910 RepID=A0ABW0L8M3_9BURK